MPSEIFCCYARKDQEFLQELRKHLSGLERQGLITLWSDIDISPGTNWEEEINKHLNIAQIFLLLISPNFLASDYCNSTEMKRAMERHQAGEAHVIPIILRPTLWERATFSQLQVLPKDAQPITSWQDRDEAFLDIARGIRKVIEGSDSHPPLPLQPPNRALSRRHVAMALGGGLVLIAAGGTYLGIRLSTQTSNGRILYSTARDSSTMKPFTVNYVMWSPDGHSLVTADGDKTVSVLDATSGARQITYANHNGYVDAAIWSPGGTEIASASRDKTVQIWNAKNGIMRLKYQAPIPLRSVAWSPNGAHLASAGDTNITQVWDANTKQLVTTYRGPTNGIWAVAWSPDSKRLAIGYADGTIQVYSATDEHLLSTYHGQSGSIYEVMWSHHSDTLISASKDHTIHAWNATDRTLRHVYSGHLTPVHAAEWSPDDTLIASGDEVGVVMIWDVATGTRIHTYTGHTDIIESVTWSPDGKHLASGSNDGTIRIWDV